jgi:hypothetical protein
MGGTLGASRSEILSIVEEQSLYAKESKCEFGMTKILYLGHVVNAQGVPVHREKIQVVLDWLAPKNLTYLCGFFGICSNYRRFVTGFSNLVAPLTNLTKKWAFRLIEETQKTFDIMRVVMTTCPVLALIDFTRPFVFECDASGECIGAVMMQQRHSITYESKKLTESKRLYSIYDKEMLAIMHALEKFRQYLVGGKFMVKTDHNNLLHFLGPKDLNERQQKWVIKLQAYDFKIEYVKGKKNVVLDALSGFSPGN